MKSRNLPGEGKIGGLMLTEILKAFAFAAKWHGKQKYGNYSFLYHCAMTAINAQKLMAKKLAMPIGWDKTNRILIAAILHDVIENTNCRYEDIQKEFGDNVANLVSLVTTAHETTEEYYGRMNEEAMLIKVADRMANLDNIGKNISKRDRWLFEKVLPKYEKELSYYKDFPGIEIKFKEAMERKGC